MARLQSFRLEDVADWRSDSSSDEEYSDAMERQPSTGSLASVLTGGWSPRSTMHTARDRASQRPMTPDGAQADLDDEGSSSPSNVESDDTAPGAGPVASRQQTPGVVSAALPFQIGCLLHGGFGLILFGCTRAAALYIGLQMSPCSVQHMCTPHVDVGLTLDLT
jgi:hypothetical protein